MDALDEGDPPEQQVLGFKGGVRAGGNQALSLVVGYLAETLPANVRFIFTTRPQAACGQIKDIMERTFPSTIQFLTQPELLRLETMEDILIGASFLD